MTAEKQIQAFCQNVKCLRQENRLTKKEMAQIMGISIPRLTRIEAGNCPRTLSISAAIQLAQFFKLSVEDLFLFPRRLI
jgi:DNA-binding XRE family transcriptional regulator